MYIEKIMALSTAHMPKSKPEFDGLRAVEFEYGYVVWVSEPDPDMPEWITPVLEKAYEADCTLILFDRDCNVDTWLPKWDW